MKQYIIMWSITRPPSYSDYDLTTVRTLITGETQEDAIENFMKSRLPMFSATPQQVKIHHIQEIA